MNPSKLLRFLLSQFSFGVVEVGGGGGVAKPEGEEEPGADDAGEGGEGAAEAGEEGEAADGASDSEGGEAAAAEAGADDEIVVTLGEEPAANDDEDARRAPEWLRELRKSNRELTRVLRERETEIARLKGPGATAAVTVGERPKLSDPDIDFDEDKFGLALDAWMTRKASADEQQRTKAQAEEQQRTRWSGRIDAVTKAAATLKVADQEEAALAFEDTFSAVQQGIVLGGPDDAKTSALLRYALGKNPKRAKQLATIDDPVKFAIAIGKLETELKVTPRKSAPPPDRVVRSSVAGSAAVDSRLTELQAQADKTGDRTKVAAYLRQKKQAA
jgi:hypothetical protein